MHAADLIGVAVDKAFEKIETRIARVEQLAVDTNKQIAPWFASLLRDIEPAPAARETAGPNETVVVIEPPESLPKPKTGDPKRLRDSADMSRATTREPVPAKERQRRHRWI